MLGKRGGSPERNIPRVKKHCVVLGFVAFLTHELQDDKLNAF